jgi:hypothetical protein
VQLRGLDFDVVNLGGSSVNGLDQRTNLTTSLGPRANVGRVPAKVLARNGHDDFLRTIESSTSMW